MALSMIDSFIFIVSTEDLIQYMKIRSHTTLFSAAIDHIVEGPMSILWGPVVISHTF